jgi:acyl dehydratase
MQSLYYEDLSLNQEFTSKGRTVTEADVVNFAGLSGDFNSLHMDEVFAKSTPFGRRIAHGMAVLSISSGLIQSLGLFEGTLLAFLGLDWKFTGPVFIGDTIHVVQKVASMRLSKSDPTRGLVVFEGRIVNQDGVTVQQGNRTVLIRCKTSGA